MLEKAVAASVAATPHAQPWQPRFKRVPAVAVTPPTPAVLPPSTPAPLVQALVGKISKTSNAPHEFGEIALQMISHR